MRATVLVLTLLALPATAAGPAHPLKKEPAYKTRPQYCLIVYGPEKDRAVWVVLDGDALYVDRNGNGDLTEAGEKVTVESPNTDPAAFKEVTVTAEKFKIQLHLFGWFAYHEEGKTDTLEPILTLSGPGGREYGAWGDERAPLVFGKTPQEAPVLHVGGPLQMGFEVRQPLTRQMDGSYELNAGLGTRGPTRGDFVHLVYNVVPPDVHPKAVLEFPNKSPGGSPVRVEMVLKERC